MPARRRSAADVLIIRRHHGFAWRYLCFREGIAYRAPAGFNACTFGRPDFATLLLEVPAPPEPLTTPSTTSSATVELKESLTPKNFDVLVFTDGLLGNDRASTHLMTGLKAHYGRPTGSVAYIALQGASWAVLADQVRQQASSFDVVVMMLQVNGCHEDGNFSGEPAKLRAELAGFMRTVGKASANVLLHPGAPLRNLTQNGASRQHFEVLLNTT